MVNFKNDIPSWKKTIVLLWWPTFGESLQEQVIIERRKLTSWRIFAETRCEHWDVLFIDNWREITFQLFHEFLLRESALSVKHKPKHVRNAELIGSFREEICNFFNSIIWLFFTTAGGISYEVTDWVMDFKTETAAVWLLNWSPLPSLSSHSITE